VAHEQSRRHSEYRASTDKVLQLTAHGRAFRSSVGSWRWSADSAQTVSDVCCSRRPSRWTALMDLRITTADFGNADQCAAIVAILDSFARGPGGQNAPLDDFARENLVKGLANQPMAVVYLAFSESRAVGVAVCVSSYSTFTGKPMINVRDLAVLPEFQNQGVGRALLDRVERDARSQGCCRVTLEVEDSNVGAKRLYKNLGFGPWDRLTLHVSKRLD